MKASEYFDAVKERLNLPSDYALCKRLEISDKTMPAMRRDERAVPVDVMFKIAIALEIDPAQVVADLEGQREKNEKRRNFWQGFISRAAITVVMVCTLVLSFSAICASGLNPLFGRKIRRYKFA